MDEVGRDGVTPAHVAPLIAGWVELEEEMVLAVEEDGAVGIVDPVGRRAEVELRPPGGCGLLGGEWWRDEESQRQDQDRLEMK